MLLTASMPVMDRAKLFAIQAHGDQKYGDQPYGVHLQEVVAVLVRFGVRSHVVLCAAWLHDVLEDTKTTAEAVLGEFGAPIAELVEAVTNEAGANRKERNLRTYPKIRRYGINAVVLKLADRIANVENALATGTPHLKMYRREFAEFSTALFVSGECDAMWDHLRGLSA